MHLEKKWYSLKEVREIVFDNSISLSSLQKLVKNGNVASVRYGNRILIPRFWVEKEIAKAIGCET